MRGWAFSISSNNSRLKGLSRMAFVELAPNVVPEITRRCPDETLV